MSTDGAGVGILRPARGARRPEGRFVFVAGTSRDGGFYDGINLSFDRGTPFFYWHPLFVVPYADKGSPSVAMPQYLDNDRVAHPLRNGPNMSLQSAVALLLISSSVRAAEPPPGRPIASIIAEAKEATGRPRSKALDELSARRPETEEELAGIADGIRSGDGGVQTAGLKALRRTEKTARHLKPRAERMLDDSSDRVQLGGFIVAARIQARELAPKIRAKLAQRPHYKVRKNDFGGITPQALEYSEEAATALVDLDDFDSIDELLSRDEIMAFSSFGGPLVARFGARALPKALALARQKETLRSDGGRGVISSMKDPEAIPQLVELSHDSDSAIASAATLSLSQVPTPTTPQRESVETTLAGHLKNPDRHIRGFAYDGLLRLNPQKHLPTALQALKDDHDIRLAVMYAIQKNRLSEAVSALEAFIKEDEQKRPNWTNDRAVAAQVIFKLTGRRVPYKGVERERRVYADPYDPSETQ